jgi:hypothetical protein
MLNGRLIDSGLMSALSLATKFNPSAAPFFAVEGDVVQCCPMAKETRLTELREMIERGFKAVAEDIGDMRKDMATKEEVADIKTEMMDQFKHVEKQFHALDARLQGIASKIAVIHRRVERLEELGASNAGFAKEIDLLLTRVTAIEKHLGIDKKIAA